jgi:hypothetical protein
MSAQPCPGTSCNGRYWKAWDAYDQALAGYDPLNPAQSRPEQPDIRWRADGNPVWCADCTARIRKELASIDRLIPRLLREADGHEGKPRTEKVGGTSEPGSPSPAADLADELDRLLVMWEDGYRKLKGWSSAPARGGDADARTEMIDWLLAHLDDGPGGILRSDYALEFGRDVLNWRKVLARSTKAGVRKLRKPLRCPRCRLITLVWEEGSDRVDCANPDCSAVYSYADYEKETGRLAGILERGGEDPVPEPQTA